MEVFPLVNNFDGADWVDITSFLNDPSARELFRQQVATFLASDKYHGLMVDFEAFPKKGQAGFLVLRVDGLRAAAQLNLGFLVLDFSDEVHHAAGILLEVGRVSFDPGFNDGTRQVEILQ